MVHVPAYVAPGAGAGHCSGDARGLNRGSLDLLVLFLALTVGSWIVVRIPKRVMYALAAATGSIAYIVAVRPRRNVQNNLAHVTGASPDQSHCSFSSPPRVSKQR